MHEMIDKRMMTSMNAFMFRERSSVRDAARTLQRMGREGEGRMGDGGATTPQKRRLLDHSDVGSIPTAPVRDQPVGRRAPIQPHASSSSLASGGDGGRGGGGGGDINLRFRYKLTNLRRKVVNDRDGKSKVVRFNESRMAKFGWLQVWNGTVFAAPSAPFIWYQLALLWGIALASFGVSYACTLYVDTSIDWKDFDNSNLEEVWEVLDEFKVVADTSQVLTTLVSFLLGLYVTKTVDIWWNMRHELLQSVLNTIDSMCCRLAIYFPGNSPEDDEAKETVLRYGVLSLKLLFKDAREVDAWNIRDRKRLGCDSLMDLVDEGLLLKHERELLKECPSRSQVIWVWIASLFTKWCLDGRLPSPVENQNTILEECNTARNNIAMILARVNTQYPMSYSHLVISMVKVLLLIQAMVAGYIFNLSLWTGYYYWTATQIVYLIVWTLFHQAMIDIKEHITNPFRDNPCDFAEMIQAARAINTNRAFFNAGKHPPYTRAGREKGEKGEGEVNPAALPPQLIVRQIISTRLRKRRNATANTAPATPVPTPE